MSDLDEAVKTLARQIEGAAYDDFRKEFLDAAISLTNLIRDVAPEGVSHDEKQMLIQKLLNGERDALAAWHDCGGVRETWIKLTTQTIVKDRTTDA